MTRSEKYLELTHAVVDTRTALHKAVQTKKRKALLTEFAERQSDVIKFRERTIELGFELPYPEKS